MNPSVNNCILCFTHWKYESWFTEGLSTSPLPYFSPPGQSPGRRRMSKRLWRQEEHRASATHESPRQTNPFVQVLAPVEATQSCSLIPVGIKGDFLMPAAQILKLFCVKAETWGSKILVLLSQFIRAYLPSLTTFMSLNLLLLFHHTCSTNIPGTPDNKYPLSAQSNLFIRPEQRNQALKCAYFSSNYDISLIKEFETEHHILYLLIKYNS